MLLLRFPPKSRFPLPSRCALSHARPVAAGGESAALQSALCSGSCFLTALARAGARAHREATGTTSGDQLVLNGIEGSVRQTQLHQVFEGEEKSLLERLGGERGTAVMQEINELNKLFSSTQTPSRVARAPLD